MIGSFQIKVTIKISQDSLRRSVTVSYSYLTEIYIEALTMFFTTVFVCRTIMGSQMPAISPVHDSMGGKEGGEATIGSILLLSILLRNKLHLAIYFCHNNNCNWKTTTFVCSNTTSRFTNRGISFYGSESMSLNIIFK